MPFVQAKCPECGGMLAVDNSKKAAVCQFCGEPFVIEDTIINNNTYNTTNHNYGDGAVVNVYENQNSVSALIERVFMFLEDGDFESADEYCEKVLDLEPENAQVYLGKLMAELRVNKKEALKICSQPFDDRLNYKKILRFGDAQLINELKGYIACIKERLETERLERERKEEAERLERERRETAERLECQRQEEARLEEERQESEFKAKRNIFIAICVTLVIVFSIGISKLDVISETKYDDALDLVESGRYLEAITKFEDLGEYKDSQQEILNAKYMLAEDYYNSEKYEEALAIYSELGDYKDSQQGILKAKYKLAEDYYNRELYEEALAIYSELGNYQDSATKIVSVKKDYQDSLLKNAEVGSFLYFGKYEQDNNIENGQEDIEWLVLAKEDNKILVISKFALDSHPYNTENVNITWENCTLRKWLNNDFKNTAFTSDEQSIIITTNNPAHKHAVYSTDPGNDTNDELFLLSNVEVEKYFTQKEYKYCEHTDYVTKKKKNSGNPYSKNSWWLRTPSITEKGACYVDKMARIIGTDVSNVDIGVRPAMWIENN